MNDLLARAVAAHGGLTMNNRLHVLIVIGVLLLFFTNSAFYLYLCNPTLIYISSIVTTIYVLQCMRIK
jgi:hypothetical protein